MRSILAFFIVFLFVHASALDIGKLHHNGPKRFAPLDEPERYTLTESAKLIEELRPRADRTIQNRMMKRPQPEDAGFAQVQEDVALERIVNGAFATKGQFPWQAAIVADSVSFCGGSLITTTFVLTAAHCVQDGSSFEVQLGAHQLSLDIEDGRVTLTTENKIVHEDFNENNLNNDIALLRLDEEVQVATFVKVIRLPKMSDALETFSGTSATISGWGRFLDSEATNSDNLQYVSMQVIPNTQCAEVFGTNLITASSLCCSGMDGKSTCNGDSGGPLIYTEPDGGKTQIAIASFVSSNGCAVGNPSGYTRVSSYLTWISNKAGIAIRP